MKNEIYQKLPVYHPPDRVWHNIHQKLDAEEKSRNSLSYIWGVAASVLLILFIAVSMTSNIKNVSKEVQITYSEEHIDTLLTHIPATNESDEFQEIENLCKAQPIKCDDEYAQSLIQQIRDLENASIELSQQASSEQNIPDLSIEKHKNYIQKEKYKRIKKLRRYLDE
ncbi:MAG: hypothetical protein NZ455_12975 [Bacteroidia bacterium]|nr:hypothetical protein [Bacteroidia bacterium]MDW8346489.1 hypothetical protein [Bacteroidia bacterium]